jgi:hypothetical protein
VLDNVRALRRLDWPDDGKLIALIRVLSPHLDHIVDLTTSLMPAIAPDIPHWI